MTNGKIQHIFLSKFISIFVSVMFFFPHISAESKTTINLLTWPDYIPLSLVERFELEHDVDIQITYYYSDAMRAQLLNNNHFTGFFDVIVLSEKSAIDLGGKGDLIAINKKQDNKMREISHPTLNKFTKYISFNLIGVAYWKDKTPQLPTWMSLFEQSNNQVDKYFIWADSDDMIDIALMATDSSTSRFDQHDLINAAKLIINTIEDTHFLSERDSNAITSTENDDSYRPMYASDAIFENKKNPNLRFSYPEDVTRIYRDFAGIHSMSKNVDLSKIFISTLTSFDGSVEMAEYNNYFPADIDAYEKIKLKKLSDKISINTFPSISTNINNNRHIDIKMELKKAYIHKRIVNATSHSKD